MWSKGSIVVVLLGLIASAKAVPSRSTRIVGGSLTTINQYPQAAALLFSWGGSTFSQSCGGTIITARSVMTAAHCVYGDSSNNWRARVGSSWANSGGYVHALARIVVNSQYNPRTQDFDIAILQVSAPFILSNTIKAGSVAGPSYVVQDNQPVWAVGWGTTSVGGAGSEQLRHVQIWSINQSVCRSRYAAIGLTVTDNMLCSGWLDVGGRDQCQGDSGGPLFHNGIVVGVCSWGNQCALAQYPGVNTRVSRFTSWIQANAI